MRRLSIVVPALDEAGRLPASLERIAAFLAASPHWLPAEVIVVDDGSSDDTAAAAGRIRPRRGVAVRVLRHDANRGKGAATRTGMLASAGGSVLVTDADLASPIEELETLAAASGPGRVVIGSRALDRRLIAIRQPWYRDLMGRSFNLLVRTLAIPGVRDTQCGFKLFPRDTAHSLAAAQRLDGFAFDVELLVLARHWGLEVVEIPVRWRHVEASRVAPGRHSAQMLRDLLRIAWWRASAQLPAAPRESLG